MIKRISLPKFITVKIDAEKYGIEEFVRFASRRVKPYVTILDAGAGESPYRKFFSTSNYIAVDFRMLKLNYSKLSVVADLHLLPFCENSIDVILCTQVLEHVKDPKLVLSELYRVMKKGGKLFLTAPQGWGLHDKPYDFFRFTKYALEYLLTSAGFKIVFIRPRGGYFWYIGNRLRPLPLIQKNRIIRFLLSPLFQIIIPYICFYLDRLDLEKDLTLGYACFCKK